MERRKTLRKMRRKARRVEAKLPSGNTDGGATVESKTQAEPPKDSPLTLNLNHLDSAYPEIEFFSYEVSRPGEAESSEELYWGEYGTLAAQLEVGYKPFAAMLAPQGKG
jgi:hypothetical protein